MGGCVQASEQMQRLERRSNTSLPKNLPSESRAKERALPEAVPNDIVAELPIIHPEQSYMSSSNHSERPQWEYNHPIHEEKIVPREMIVDQSTVNIIYSSDAHDPTRPKEVLLPQKLPFSLVIMEEPAENSLSAGSSRSQKEQQAGKQPASQCTRAEDFVPERRAVIASSLQVKQAVSVVQDMGAFNEEKTIDVIGFDLRFLKVQISPRLQQ